MRLDIISHGFKFVTGGDSEDLNTTKKGEISFNQIQWPSGIRVEFVWELIIELGRGVRTQYLLKLLGFITARSLVYRLESFGVLQHDLQKIVPRCLPTR